MGSGSRLVPHFYEKIMEEMYQFLFCVHHFTSCSNNPFFFEFFTLELACCWAPLNKFTSGVIALTATELSQEQNLSVLHVTYFFPDVFVRGFLNQKLAQKQHLLLMPLQILARQNSCHKLEKEKTSLPCT